MALGACLSQLHAADTNGLALGAGEVSLNLSCAPGLRCCERNATDALHKLACLFHSPLPSISAPRLKLTRRVKSSRVKRSAVFEAASESRENGEENEKSAAARARFPPESSAGEGFAPTTTERAVRVSFSERRLVSGLLCLKKNCHIRG